MMQSGMSSGACTIVPNQVSKGHVITLENNYLNEDEHFDDCQPATRVEVDFDTRKTNIRARRDEIGRLVSKMLGSLYVPPKYPWAGPVYLADLSK